jgi:hypothetical protein
MKPKLSIILFVQTFIARHASTGAQAITASTGTLKATWQRKEEQEQEQEQEQEGIRRPMLY